MTSMRTTALRWGTRATLATGIRSRAALRGATRASCETFQPGFSRVSLRRVRGASKSRFAVGRVPSRLCCSNLHRTDRLAHGEPPVRFSAAAPTAAREVCRADRTEERSGQDGESSASGRRRYGRAAACKVDVHGLLCDAIGNRDRSPRSQKPQGPRRCSQRTSGLTFIARGSLECG